MNNTVKYIPVIQKDLMKVNSFMDTIDKKVVELFTTFGLTNEQSGQVYSKFMNEASKIIRDTSYSIGEKINQVDNEYVRIDTMIKTEEGKKDLVLAKIELEKQRGLTLDQKIAGEPYSKEKVDAEIEIVKAQTEIEKNSWSVEKYNTQITVLEKDIETDRTQSMVNLKNQYLAEKAMYLAQQSLLSQQKLGYGNNNLIRAAEHTGGLASFAINSASTSANTTLAKFRSAIVRVKARG